MSTEFADAALQQIREVITLLEAPIPDLKTLISLLCSPLGALGILPPQYLTFNVNPLSSKAFSIHRHIPPLQRAILLHIVPTWYDALKDENALLLLDQYFCPDLFASASPAASEITMQAYSTILSTPFIQYSLQMLARLSKAYPIDKLHAGIFSSGISNRRTTTAAWEDCVRNVCAVPAKASNAVALSQGTLSMPRDLDSDAYFNRLSARCEVLVADLTTRNEISQGMLPRPSLPRAATT
jgi:telomere length regulation protein